MGHEDLLPTEPYQHLSFPDLDQINEIHGTPLEDMAFWHHQQADYSCAVASTTMCLNALGIPVTESELAQRFEHDQVYDPTSGSDTEQLANEINNIAHEHEFPIHATELRHFDAHDLQTQLDAHNKVMVSVHSKDLWSYHNNDPLSSILDHFFGPSGIDHEVMVIGETPDGNSVILHDPGLADGSGNIYPKDVFMNATNQGSSAVAVSRTA